MKNIVVHLNCHTHPIASALADVFSPSEYNILKVINFKKESISDSLLKNCKIYIYQCLEGDHWGQYISDFFLNKLPDDCKSICYPILRFNPFWPFNTKNSLKTELDEIIKSKDFPDGDKFLLSKIDKYTSANELADEYLSQDINSMINLDDEFEKILKWYESPRNAKDINVKDFVLKYYKDKILFHTVDHISDFFLNYMIDKLFRLLDLKKNKEYSCKFMINNNVPIHPSIINYYKISYLNKKSLYLYNGEYLSIRDFYIKYIIDIMMLTNKDIHKSC